NAFARSRNFVPLAKIFMRHLMDQAGETVNLATQDNEEIVYLAQVECREMMRAFVKPGARTPMYCSAVGKALLAAQPEAEFVRAQRQRSFALNDPNAVLKTPQFLSTLDKVRRCGYALDDEEQSIGMRCVAAVIYDENGDPLAAISVSGPSARITNERIPVLGALVAKTCGDITTDFGGRLPGDIDLPQRLS
ncbi:MAG TPA: IclR family transcriptional regulator, partial [Rhodospirillales bacterium]|nr:IclR family transcriptional regulator [Rhodospirillales bacterium]